VGTTVFLPEAEVRRGKFDDHPLSTRPRLGPANMSPFCVKLETYLRMAGNRIPSGPGRFQKGPLGRIPYAEIDGKTMGDTTLIIDRLKQKFGDPLDERSPPSRRPGVALQRPRRTHLYFFSGMAPLADPPTSPGGMSAMRSNR